MSAYGEYAQTKAALHHLGVEEKKEKKYTKQEAIEYALKKASCIYTFPREPGYVVQHLPKEIRDVLKECSSEEWKHRLS